MSKLPSFQFYPGDWMKDPALRSVSAAARGLWIDLLCLLFESKSRHKMDFNSRLEESTLISRMTGVSQKQVSKYLKELEEANVFSRDSNGMIYSRRLERDEKLREIRRKAGSLGGNPILVKQKLKHVDNQVFNQTPTPSSSTSSSYSNIDKATTDILTFWNSSGLLASKDINAVLKALKGGRTPEEIVDAISNYKKILGSDDFLLETRWTLGVFLTKHIEKFLSGQSAEKFYRRRNGTNEKAYDVSPGEAYESFERKEHAISQ